MQYTIAKALKELKTLDARIQREIKQGVYSGVVKQDNPTNSSYKTANDLKNAIKGTFDSIEKLQDNRNKIKAAVIQSNATTFIDLPIIGNVSIAQAIEYKEVINMRRSFINKAVAEYRKHQQEYDIQKDHVNNLIEQRIAAALGNQDQKDDTMSSMIRKQVEQEYSVEFINPKNIEDWAKKELDKVEEFADNVDDLINTSNVMTTIEVALN